MFRFRTWYTIQSSFDTAIQQLIEDATRDARGCPPDVALLFVSEALAHRADDAREAVWQTVRPQTLVGTTSSGVIAEAYEFEHEPALVLMVGWLPGVQVRSFALHPPDWRAVLQDATDFCTRTYLSQRTRIVLLLADPFTTPVEHVLDAFDMFVPGVPVVGGEASITAGGNRLFEGATTHKAGLVGLTLSGNLEVDVVVSTGCRPVSPVFKVTGARNNVILSGEQLARIATLTTWHRRASSSSAIFWAWMPAVARLPLAMRFTRGHWCNSFCMMPKPPLMTSPCG